MNKYVNFKNHNNSFNIPFEGSIDITYRCNNNCRHCWINIPASSKRKEAELSFDEIKRIVEEARSMGCRKWYISGGEPMLRPDFPEIFNLIVNKSMEYTLNTNATLITPRIAKLMKKKGIKLISVYGADEEVNDHITRVPGSFQAAMRGISLLKEAGAGFIIQLVPMKDNYHQIKDMIKLAESLSPQWRFGASWLYSSAEINAVKNREIEEQRLTPDQVVEIEPPSFYDLDEDYENQDDACCPQVNSEGRLSKCVDKRSSFHIDPYGMLSFCQFIKDPALRINLKKDSLKKAWEVIIPDFSVKLSEEYTKRKNDDSQIPKIDHQWCPVYSYLETRDYYSNIKYLSDIETMKQKKKLELEKDHVKYFEIGGVTIRVESDLPMNDSTFDKRFRNFEVNGPGKDNVFIRHHFELPDLTKQALGKEIYRLPPWAVYQKKDSFIYVSIGSGEKNTSPSQIGVFRHNYSKNRIFNGKIWTDIFKSGGFPVISLSPTDQLLLSHIFAERNACYFHSSGIIYKNFGYLFMGHSGAGKSTLATYLSNEVEILCDDRNIVRKTGDEIKVYGSWSHGDFSMTSPNSAPLKKIFILVKDDTNEIEIVENRKVMISKLLAFLIKPIQLASWWEKSLDLIETIVTEIPVYFLHFRRDKDVKEILKDL